MADVRLIDANALKKHLRNLVASGGHKYYRKGMDDTLHRHMPNIIDDQPTVDAVPVVRCRDCRKSSIRNDVITRQKEYICLLTRDHREVEADGFCSAGERKEN